MRLLGLLLVLIVSENVHAEASQLRIVSLSPYLTEMVFSAGAGKYLVGVDSYSDYPAAAKTLTKVGDAFHINYERILSIKPDLVLAWRYSIKPRDLNRFKALGLPVYISDIKTLNDIPNEIESIGRQTGTQRQAFAKAQELRHQLTYLRQEYSTRSAVTAFYQIWNQPLTTINGEQFISKGLALCGAKNVFAHLKPIAPQVNKESLLAANPQIILMGGNAQDQKHWRQEWTKFPMIQAVKHHQIIGVNSDLYQRPTARFIEALPHLCELIQQARQADSSVN